MEPVDGSSSELQLEPGSRSRSDSASKIRFDSAKLQLEPTKPDSSSVTPPPHDITSDHSTSVTGRRNTSEDHTPPETIRRSRSTASSVSCSTSYSIILHHLVVPQVTIVSPASTPSHSIATIEETFAATALTSSSSLIDHSDKPHLLKSSPPTAQASNISSSSSSSISSFSTSTATSSDSDITTTESSNSTIKIPSATSLKRFEVEDVEDSISLASSSVPLGEGSTENLSIGDTNSLENRLSQELRDKAEGCATLDDGCHMPNTDALSAQHSSQAHFVSAAHPSAHPSAHTLSSSNILIESPSHSHTPLPRNCFSPIMPPPPLYSQNTNEFTESFARLILLMNEMMHDPHMPLFVEHLRAHYTSFEPRKVLHPFFIALSLSIVGPVGLHPLLR